MFSKPVALLGLVILGVSAQVNGQAIPDLLAAEAGADGLRLALERGVRLEPALRGLLTKNAQGAATTATGRPAGRERAAAAVPATAQPSTTASLDAAKVQAVGVIVQPRDPELHRKAMVGETASIEFIEEVRSAALVQLEYERAMSGGMFVFRFTTLQTYAAAEAVTARLSALPSVAHVEPDLLVRSHTVSSDPLFVAYQWNMLGSLDGYAGGIDAAAAWEFTTGSSRTVVAVVDSGVNPHPEFAARLVPGFDFVSDSSRSNDGNGRDTDASDPGDYAFAGECGPGAPFEPSSWHGTHVAGIVGATGGNGYGIAGVNWRTYIQPVRVLGKCGGSVSDIIDGINWAAGLPVPGTPPNPTPAHVINLSLGGYSPSGCSLGYQSAINRAIGQGALVVVAAGNSSDNAALYTPANCEGVLTVMALGPYGATAPYTNFGFVSDLSAPGGDMTTYGTFGGILSTVSSGVTSPTGYDWKWQHGTSMAAPHVSGIAAIALAINPNLSGAELVFLLQFGATPFPPQSACGSLGICGAGIANALGGAAYALAFSDYRLVYEFYNTDLKHFFRTGAKEEAALVNSGWAGEGWFETLDYFYGWSGPLDGARPVCRFYAPVPNSHFYTADAAECEAVKRYEGWIYEGIVFYMKVPVDGSCPPNTSPVHRYYNMRWRENDSNHRYSADISIFEYMTSMGWVYEGVAFCAAASSSDAS